MSPRPQVLFIVRIVDFTRYIFLQTYILTILRQGNLVINFMHSLLHDPYSEILKMLKNSYSFFGTSDIVMSLNSSTTQGWIPVAYGIISSTQ